MNVCHILPPRVLRRFENNLDPSHLLLPSLMKNEDYRNFYREKATIDWLTLDNGVAEGHMVSFGHIMAMAKLAQVQEVVLPDVLGDMDKTLTLLSQTFYEAFQYRNQFRFMFVPQGSTINEVIHCAEQAMNMCPVLISCFGIPRHILSVAPSARAQIAYELNEQYGDREIHLLGTHPDHVTELAYYADDFKNADVRSVDTSLAWNATRENVRLNGPESLNYNLSIARQPIDEFAAGSFDHADQRYLKLLKDNMEAINSWV